MRVFSGCLHAAFAKRKISNLASTLIQRDLFQFNSQLPDAGYFKIAAQWLNTNICFELSTALSYQILIGEVVAQFGRTLATSYGWSEAKFTGAAPGAKANICSAL